MSLPIAASKIVNLIPYPTMSSGWSAGTSDYYMGKPCRYLDSKSGAAEVTMSTNDSIQLVKGHTYYARVSAYMRFGFGSTVDIYWPIAEPSFLSGHTLTKDKWTVCSNVIVRNNWSDGSYQLRLDHNNTKSGIRVYFAEAMLIDLTATYGAGNEPSAAWCDENIPFFEGTYYTTPSAVTNLSAQVNNGLVSLSWLSSEGATGYRVIRDGTQVSDQAGLTFSEIVTKGNSYTYSVVAYNDSGESDATTITVLVPLVLPSSPTGFAATIDDGMVSLSWSASSEATGYRLSRDGVQISDQTGTTYTETLAKNQSYTYSLVAYNDDGDSAPATLTVTVPLEPPAAPTGLSASVSHGVVSLSWNAAAKATGYRLYRDGTLLANQTGTGYADNIGAAGEYYYTLIAYNDDGDSPAATLTVTVVLPPSAPAELRMTARTRTTISLAWDAVSGAEGYRLYRNGVQIYNGTAVSYIDTGLSTETTYTYAVEAFNSGGASTRVTLEATTTGLVLITDRTQQDVGRILELAKKLNAGTATVEELAEWNSIVLKGSYDYSDLNRVGDAVQYLSEILKSHGYDCPVSPKLDWSESGRGAPSDMAQYLQNVQTLRGILTLLPETPNVPADMEKLTWQEANAIEQILVDLESTIKTMLKTRVACGDAYCGGEYL